MIRKAEEIKSKAKNQKEKATLKAEEIKSKAMN